MPHLRDLSRGPGLPGPSPAGPNWPLHTVPPVSELRSESPPGVGRATLSCLHPQGDIFTLCPSQRKGIYSNHQIGKK